MVQPKYSQLLRGSLSLITVHLAAIAPHAERVSVPPSSWQPGAVGESRTLAPSGPELKSQPAHCCGTPGLLLASLSSLESVPCR